MKRVRDINWNNPNIIRAGIIPFVDVSGVRLFAFGVENGVAAIGDFGGHREKKDIDALDAALREYQEEALNVFGEINREMVQDYYAIEGNDTIEILLPVSGPFYQYTEIFHQLVWGYPDHEVQSIIWLSRRQLLTAIDSQEESYEGTKIYHMYSRILETLRINREYI